jgi:hypothetical protein
MYVNDLESMRDFHQRCFDLRGYVHCDAVDPEGNILQLRRPR